MEYLEADCYVRKFQFPITMHELVSTQTPTDDCSLVGNEPWTFVKITDILNSSGTSETLWNNLPELSRRLDIPSGICCCMKRRLSTDTATNTEILYEILEAWRMKAARDASIFLLIRVLEKMGLNDSADALRNEMPQHQRNQSKLLLFKDDIIHSTKWEHLSESLKIEIGEKLIDYQCKKIKLNQLGQDVEKYLDGITLKSLANDEDSRDARSIISCLLGRRDMFAKAGTGVCWVEKQHKLHPIDDQGIRFSRCHANLRFEDNAWQYHYDFQINIQKRLGNDPNENQKPTKEYPTTLQDSSKGDYPFRGLAHCLIEIIEQNNGAEDLAALNSHWLNPKPFAQATLDRENENRARHGVPPFTLHSELSSQAQWHAEELARICKMIHIKSNPDYGRSHPDARLNGTLTGESVSRNTALSLTDNEMGVDAANRFYAEIKHFSWPVPDDYYKKGDVSHFLSSVWKSTEFAGYGIGRSNGCNYAYVVARYFHPGPRYIRAIRENILPPI
ncbi:unnamed protein product [Orchesella dallaii]|uniref:Death domain-containing protein n=1 Tax=Orchesella dallaii TaxID=48710 RepID=A0ABP1RMM6_9HEXA